MDKDEKNFMVSKIGMIFSFRKRFEFAYESIWSRRIESQGSFEKKTQIGMATEVENAVDVSKIQQIRHSETDKTIESHLMKLQESIEQTGNEKENNRDFNLVGTDFQISNSVLRIGF